MEKKAEGNAVKKEEKKLQITELEKKKRKWK